MTATNLHAIQSTAAASPGSSGGPLLDPRGRVVGVTYGGYPRGENLHLAVHAEAVKALISTAGSPKPFAGGENRPSGVDAFTRAIRSLIIDRPEEAMRQLRALQPSMKDVPEYWRERATVELRLRTVDDARVSFNRVIALDPTGQPAVLARTMLAVLDAQSARPSENAPRR